MKQRIKKILQQMTPGAGKPERTLAFVVSAPRSGSTWLKRALNEHPDVYCTEHRLFGDYYDVVPNRDDTVTLRLTLDQYVKTLSGYYDCKALGLTPVQFRRHILEHLVNAMCDFAWAESSKPVLVDKITPYRGTAKHVLQQIRRYTPQAKLIHLVRDGRDVCTSGVFDWIARTKRKHPRYAVFVERRGGVRLRRFFDDDDLAQWAEEWAGPIRAFTERRAKPLTIRYEEMKQDQRAVLEPVFAYLGASCEAETVQRCIEASSFRKMSAGRAPGQGVATAKVRKGVAGDWKNYFTRRDGERFHELAGDCLVKLGYADDGDWVQALPKTLNLTADNVR